jgi:hypothetical protein
VTPPEGDFIKWERECLLNLMRAIADPHTANWALREARGCRLVGAYPETVIEAFLVRGPNDEPYTMTYPLWRKDGGPRYQNPSSGELVSPGTAASDIHIDLMGG